MSGIWLLFCPKSWGFFSFIIFLFFSVEENTHFSFQGTAHLPYSWIPNWAVQWFWSLPWKCDYTGTRNFLGIFFFFFFSLSTALVTVFLNLDMYLELELCLSHQISLHIFLGVPAQRLTSLLLLKNTLQSSTLWRQRV